MVTRLAHSEKDAWEQIEQIVCCANCAHFKQIDLFSGHCGRLSGHLDGKEKCEAFESPDKKIGYRIAKLVEMAMEFSGENDFHRQLDSHQRKQTDHQFLFSE